MPSLPDSPYMQPTVAAGGQNRGILEDYIPAGAGAHQVGEPQGLERVAGVVAGVVLQEDTHLGTTHTHMYQHACAQDIQYILMWCTLGSV